MTRRVLTNAHWAIIKPYCLGKSTDPRETGTLTRYRSAGHLLADRAFDADWLRNDLLDRGITPDVPPKSN